VSGKSAAERIRERGQRQAAAARPTPEPTDHTEVVAPPEPIERSLPAAPAVRTKPVRSSIDMPPSRHASLKAWCGETAVMLGKSDLPKNDVVNALVSRLLTDETLARKIRDDLRKSSGK
jgi:hypothetical protein